MSDHDQCHNCNVTQESIREIFTLLHGVREDMASVKTMITSDKERIGKLETTQGELKSRMDKQLGGAAVLIAIGAAISFLANLAVTAWEAVGKGTNA